MTSAAKRAGRNAGSVIFVFLAIIFVTWSVIKDDRVSPPVPTANLQPSSVKIVEGLFGFKDAMAWSPDSKYVAVGTFINGGQKGQLLVFDASSGKNVLTHYSHNNGSGRSMRVSASATRAAKRKRGSTGLTGRLLKGSCAGRSIA